MKFLIPIGFLLIFLIFLLHSHKPIVDPEKIENLLSLEKRVRQVEKVQLNYK